MRIAYIADPDLPGGWYRGIGPMDALGARGHEIRQLWPPEGTAPPRHAGIAGCDVLHIHRRHGDDVLELVRSAKQQGIVVVFDNDDDMLAVPTNNVAARDYRGTAGARALRQLRRLMQLADLTTTPSPLIAERFREYGAAHVEVIENYVPDAVLSAVAPSHGSQVVVGWLAGREHHVDVERMPIRDQLGRLLDAYPQLVVETIGVGLGLRHERCRNVPKIPFFKLPAHMAQYDVGLAPIADIPFNRARSSIKLKEYAALGRPWLASPVGPYAALGEQEGGRLVADDDWFEAIARLVEKPRELRKLAKRAQRWGRRQTISANAGLWEAALSAAVARAGSVPRERAARQSDSARVATS